MNLSFIFAENLKCMKRVLIALFVLLSFNGYGQNVLDNIEVVFGPSFEVDKRSVPTEFVGSDETGFYMVYSMGKKGFGDNYLYKFGYDLKPLINKDLSVLTGGQKTEADNVFMLKGQLYQIIRTQYTIYRLQYYLIVYHFVSFWISFL